MSRKLLLVEGKDDEHVFKAIFGQHDLGRLDGFVEHGGYDALIEALPLRLIESDVARLGVVVDADESASNRWDAVRHCLREAGYLRIPSAPPSEGLVLEAPVDSILPRFGVWIMPDNALPGILEHFLAALVPSGDELYAMATGTVDAIPSHLRRFREVDVQKVKIHTYLAWQDQPGRPLGQSITQRVLRADSPSCEVVANWLRRLYLA